MGISSTDIYLIHYHYPSLPIVKTFLGQAYAYQEAAKVLKQIIEEQKKAQQKSENAIKHRSR